MKIYIAKCITQSPHGNAGTYVTLEPYYTKRKSAEQRVRRALRRGIPNHSSGNGNVAVAQAWVAVAQLISGKRI